MSDPTVKNGRSEQNSSSDMAELWSYETALTDPDTVCLTSYKGDGTKIIIPQRIGGNAVSALEKELFSPRKAGRTAEQQERLKKISSVTIPEGVAEIGYGVFSGCENLRSITIPSGVTYIGGAAFADCAGLDSVTLPDGVTGIGNRAFAGCTGLNSITVPDSVADVGYYAFADCTGLNSITIPESMTEIGYGVFSGCENLRSITIPSGVTYIGGAAFEKCRSLKSVTVPEGVTTIGNRAFADCAGLKSVTIPETVTRMGMGVFGRCDALINMIAGPSQYDSAWFKETAVKTYLRTPEAFQNEKQTEDVKRCFFAGRNVFLPYVFKEDLVHGLHLLADAGRITESRIDNDFVEPAIEAGATQCIAFLMDWKHKNVSDFDEAELLMMELEKELDDTPDISAELSRLWSFKKIDGSTVCLIGYKGTETEIIIPEAIGKYAVGALEDELFYPGRGERGRSNMPEKRKRTAQQNEQLKKIASVTIPASVEHIGKGAFRDCVSLSRVIIPKGVTDIGSYAFCGCTALTCVELPDSMTAMGGSVFDGCADLSRITVPNSVANIGKWAFAGCKNLTVFAPTDSYAEQYAKENGLKFEAEDIAE